MKRIIRAFALLVLCAAAYAQQFPQVEAETLAGKKLAFPGAAAGHAAIVVVGFTHASQSQTMAWSRRLWSDYPPAAPVTVWSIAVLQDAPRLVRGMAVHGIKSGVPKDRQDRFLLLYRNEAELKQAAAFDRPDDAYLLLLDPAGTVRWRFHGALTDPAAAELKAAIARLDEK